ncbi:MAG TPA: DEAD/DEAH box helicase [Deltaproteobacteria bacterium]|nr:DEAD/DEAH box helicase [Deltaproteobacteria bacterium]
MDHYKIEKTIKEMGTRIISEESVTPHDTANITLKNPSLKEKCMKFNELDLNEDLTRGIHATGYTSCTPVQEATFVHTLKNRDVCVQSQTGTGKTAAFLISLFELILKHPDRERAKALIITPTRELASQIETEAEELGRYLNLVVGTFYGGVGYKKQESLLKKGVDIMIGTPGRLLDLSGSGKLDLTKTAFLVIDEADRLLDMGFLPDLRKILRRMPPYNKRLTMLFSATLSYRARELAWEHMNDPAEIEIIAEHVTVENVSQVLYHVGNDEKMNLLLGILEKENPKNALIFTNTKHAAYEVAGRLKVNGYDTNYIIGDLPQQRRLQVIEDIKSENVRFLVATNVAARGLHVDDLEMVINYDVPEDCEDYVHRIGRTARAGKAGKAVTLACEQYAYGLEAIEKFTQQKIPVEWPGEDIFVEDKSAGMRFHLRSDTNKVPRKPIRARHATPVKNTAPKSVKKHRAPVAAKKPRQTPPKQNTQRPKPSEDRLAYYARKYGDTFKAKTSGDTSK